MDYDFTKCLVFKAAQNSEPGVGKFCPKARDKAREIFGRPTLVSPARPRLKDDPAAACRFPFCLDGLSNRRSRRQPFVMRMDRHAEPGQHRQVPVNGVGVKTFARYGDIVEAARPFTSFVQPDQKILARQPAEDRAAQQALQINDEVEFLGPEPADAAEHFRPVSRMSPAPAFEVDQPCQIRISLQERGERRIDPPENVRLAEMTFEQTEHGQSLNDVAKRAGFENEDFQMKKLKRRKKK